jgi:hypothetical protein
MERVAFLIEDTGERLSCLLNPNTVVMRRAAGVRLRRSASGELTGAHMADAPLLHTGGGVTELELELLFDVNIAGASIATDDVRALTRPFWDLAENFAGDAPGNVSGYARSRLRVVRFVWGKSWDIPGVVAAVAERVEHFTDGGAPQRSWMRMRLVRVSEAVSLSGASPATARTTAFAEGPSPTGLPAPTPPVSPESLESLRNLPLERTRTHPILGADQGDGGSEPRGRTSQRLDEISYRYYRRPDLWRVIAAANDIADPMHMPTGTVLRVPQL